MFAPLLQPVQAAAVTVILSVTVVVFVARALPGVSMPVAPTAPAVSTTTAALGVDMETRDVAAVPLAAIIFATVMSRPVGEVHVGKQEDSRSLMPRLERCRRRRLLLLLRLPARRTQDDVGVVAAAAEDRVPMVLTVPMDASDDSRTVPVVRVGLGAAGRASVRVSVESHRRVRRHPVVAGVISVHTLPV